MASPIGRSVGGRDGYVETRAQGALWEGCVTSISLYCSYGYFERLGPAGNLAFVS